MESTQRTARALAAHVAAQQRGGAAKPGAAPHPLHAYAPLGAAPFGATPTPLVAHAHNQQQYAYQQQALRHTPLQVAQAAQVPLEERLARAEATVRRLRRDGTHKVRARTHARTRRGAARRGAGGGADDGA